MFAPAWIASVPQLVDLEVVNCEIVVRLGWEKLCRRHGVSPPSSPDVRPPRVAPSGVREHQIVRVSLCQEICDEGRQAQRATLPVLR